VLKWLREHGCPWDEGTCNLAAENGHFETLKWAREHGCPWTWWTDHYAQQHSQDNPEMLRWVRANNCPREREEGVQ